MKKEKKNIKKDTILSSNKNPLSLSVLIIVIILVSIIFFYMIGMFITSIIIASALTVLFYPLYRLLQKFFKNKKNLCALVTCLILMLLFFIPTYLLIHLVVLQTFELYEKAEPFIKNIIDLIQNEDKGLIFLVKKYPLLSNININIDSLKSIILEGIKLLSTTFTFIINKTSKGVATLIGNLFIIFFIMFYLFRDGEKIIKRLIYLSPLKPEYEKKIIDKFIITTRATIKGIFLIGLIQGFFSALTLLIFGIKTWLLWGFLIVLLSVIPFMGSWIILVPIGIVQLLIGNIWQGITIILICIVFISNIDNVLKPVLIGTEAKIHDLFIFFSSIGGIAIFGLMGFIIGPIIASLFVTILEIYSIEFKSILINNNH